MASLKPYKIGDGRVRLYSTIRGRKIAIAHLEKKGNDYFQGFKTDDRDYPYGLSFGKMEWTERSTR